MNEKAKTFAEGFNRYGGGNTLHIYEDGLVMILEGPADRHLAAKDILLKDFPGFEEGRHGNLSAFMVPMEVGNLDPLDLPRQLIGPTDGFKDHRQEDYYTLDHAIYLLTKGLEALQAKDGQHRHGERSRP